MTVKNLKYITFLFRKSKSHALYQAFYEHVYLLNLYMITLSEVFQFLGPSIK